MTSNTEYHDEVLQFPYRGAPTTVATIRQAALDSQKYYHVRQLAEIACKGVEAKDYISEPLAIYYFVCIHTVYRRDPRTVELIKAPWVVARQILDGHRPQVDCDDLCALICAMCLSVGASVRCLTLAFRHMFHKGDRQYSHITAQAADPRSNVWITLDPVAGPKTKEMLSRAVAVKIWGIA